MARAGTVVDGRPLAGRFREETGGEMFRIAGDVVAAAFAMRQPPVDLRLRRSGTEVVLEVQDRAAVRPRRRLAHEDDEHGRGMLIVSTLADAWGTRSIGTGKSVWATRSVEAQVPARVGAR